MLFKFLLVNTLKKTTLLIKKLFKKDYANEAGISFVEILVWIAVFIAFTGTAVIVGMAVLRQANPAAAKNQIESFKIALNIYLNDCRSYPSQEQGLEALLQKPVLEPVPEKWNGPYLETKELPKDPWDNDYIYRTPGPNNLPFEIISLGADKMEGGDGENRDIASWE